MSTFAHCFRFYFDETIIATNLERDRKMSAQVCLNTLKQSSAANQSLSCCSVSIIKPISLASVSRKAIFFSFSIGKR